MVVRRKSGSGSDHAQRLSGMLADAPMRQGRLRPVLVATHSPGVQVVLARMRGQLSGRVEP